MWHVGNRLHETLDFLRTDLIDQQGQNNRKDEAHDQCPKGNADGVGHDLAKQRVVEEFQEVFETDEFAAGQAFGRIELAEGELDAPHRHVGEQSHEEQCRSGKNPQLPVAT